MRKRVRINSREAFVEWLDVSAPGDVAFYYEGMLMEARIANTVALRRRVWRAYIDGMVHLTQRRVTTSTYQYFATKARTPYNALPESRQSVHRVQYTQRAKKILEAQNGSGSRANAFVQLGREFLAPV